MKKLVNAICIACLTVPGFAQNFGIGTSSPSEKLDVNGYIKTSQGVKFPNGTVQTTAAPKIYRSQVATGNQYNGWLPGSITFQANAGEWVTLRISYTGRPNAGGHTYVDLYLDGAYVKGIGEEQYSTWRRTIDGEVHRTVSSTGNHTFTAYFSCGSGASYMYDSGGEWPYGGLTWTVVVGGN